MVRVIRRLTIVVALTAVGAVILHRVRHQAVPAGGGVLIADVSMYDRLAGWLFGGFYTRVADDVATGAGPGARVLDVGCGPGHLAERLADRGLRVTAIDLDPAMVKRARVRLGPRAEVAVADVVALPFADGSFDLVVSTMSMHHWADHQAGVAEIARVLAPDGRALIFDFAGTHIPLHGHVLDPAHHVAGSALELVSETTWRWPGPVTLLRRVEARASR